MRISKFIALIGFVLASGGTTSVRAQQIQVVPIEGAADIHWIGVSTPSTQVLWLSGSKGTIARSIDGGQSWQISQPSGAAELQFRDIEALDRQHAYALSIGENGDSRVYYTQNGGQEWVLQYRGRSEQFLNCLDVSHTSGEAWVYGDSLEGRWDMVRSADGRNWLPVRNLVDSAPAAGEGGLAASGGCVRYHQGVWAIATANATNARVLIKRERGIRFKAIDTPMVAGPSAGIASIWPYSVDHWLLAGGDLTNPEREPRLLEYKNREFTELSTPPLSGALYSLSVTRDDGIVISNPQGAAWLPNRSAEWVSLSDANIWNSSCVQDHCYLVGKDGYVAKFHWQRD